MTAALTGYATAKRDLHLALKQAAQANFNAAAAALATAGAAAQELVTSGADLDREVAGLRQQLAAPANTPATIADLNDTLAGKLLTRRHLAAQLIIAREREQRAEALRSLYQDSLTELAASLGAAETELADARSRQLRHDTWTGAAVEDEVVPLRAAAADLLADSFVADPEAAIDPGQLLADARARVDGDIPAALRDRARARAALVAGRLDDFRAFQVVVAERTLTQAAVNEGTRGALVAGWADFSSAENALRDYALTTARQYARALELLQSVINSPTLSAAEAAAISAAALAADAGALTTEADLHDLRVAILAKELDMEAARFAALAADVDADPEADAAVAALRDELADLEAELAPAATAHTTAFAAALDTWEAAVPDHVWANLQALDRALELLGLVADSDRAPLVAELTTSETALISALAADDRARRLTTYLDAMHALADSQYQYLAEVDSGTRFSALRGDF